MYVKEGKFTVQKGSVLCPIMGEGLRTNLVLESREKALIENDVLQNDVEFTSPSLAAAFVIYGPANGWDHWKTADGKSINIFRKK